MIDDKCPTCPNYGKGYCDCSTRLNGIQSKKESLIESFTSTAIGFGVSLVSTFIVFPIVGIESSLKLNLQVTIYFTAISVLRGYLIRRYFNKK